MSILTAQALPVVHAEPVGVPPKGIREATLLAYKRHIESISYQYTLKLCVGYRPFQTAMQRFLSYESAFLDDSEPEVFPDIKGVSAAASAQAWANVIRHGLWVPAAAIFGRKAALNEQMHNRILELETWFGSVFGIFLVNSEGFHRAANMCFDRDPQHIKAFRWTLLATDYLSTLGSTFGGGFLASLGLKFSIGTVLRLAGTLLRFTGIKMTSIEAKSLILRGTGWVDLTAGDIVALKAAAVAAATTAGAGLLSEQQQNQTSVERLTSLISAKQAARFKVLRELHKVWNDEAGESLARPRLSTNPKLFKFIETQLSTETLFAMKDDLELLKESKKLDASDRYYRNLLEFWLPFLWYERFLPQPEMPNQLCTDPANSLASKLGRNCVYD